jgi:hypothetical protein
MPSLTELYRLKNNITGSEIKNLYESEPNTNPFTDTEKNKLETLNNSGSGLTTLTANKTYYVHAENGDDNNDGSELEPFATIEKALSVLKTIDANGFRVRIIFTGIFEIPSSGYIVVPPIRCRELSIQGNDNDEDAELLFTPNSDEYCFLIRSSSTVVNIEYFTINYDNTDENHWYYTTVVRAHGQNYLIAEEIQFNLPKQGYSYCFYLSGEIVADISDCSTTAHPDTTDLGGYFIEARDSIVARINWCSFNNANLSAIFYTSENALIYFNSIEGTINDNTDRYYSYDQSEVIGYFGENFSGGRIGYSENKSPYHLYERKEIINWSSVFSIKEQYNNYFFTKNDEGDIQYTIYPETVQKIRDGYRITIQKNNDNICRITPLDGVTVNNSTDDFILANNGDYVILRKIENDSWETFYGRKNNNIPFSNLTSVPNFAEITTVPPTNDSEGSVGQIALDNDYFYCCVAEDTWVRAPLATW